MAAPVLPLQQVKLAAGSSRVTPEQSYWRTFKSQLQIQSPSNSPIRNISTPPPPTASSLDRSSDQFAITTGTRVQIFSIRTRKLLKTITRFDDIAHSAEIRRDGRVMVAGDDSGAIQVFDVSSRAILKTWKEHKQPVWSTKWSLTDPTQLLSASDDRTLRLWDLPTEESVTTFTGHQDYIRAAAYMPGQASGLLLSGSYDQTVRLWDPRTPSAAVMTFKHSAPVEAILPLPTGTTVLGASGSQLSILDLVAAKPLTVLHPHQKTITALSLASNNTRLATASLDGSLKIFETAGWNLVASSKYPSPILSLAIIPSPSTSSSSSEDRHIAVGTQSGLLSLKTRLSGPQKIKERARAREMQALVDGRITAHDAQTGKKKQRGKGWEKRFRGTEFRGEGADIVIPPSQRSSTRAARPKQWEVSLRKGHYGTALDEVLAQNHLATTVTLLTALRHRSALRTALSGRDEVTLLPVLKWVCTYVRDPRYVGLCVDVGVQVLELYAEEMGEGELGEGARGQGGGEVGKLRRRLHQVVRREVEGGVVAGQTLGMLGLVMGGGGGEGG